MSDMSELPCMILVDKDKVRIHPKLWDVIADLPPDQRAEVQEFIKVLVQARKNMPPETPIEAVMAEVNRLSPMWQGRPSDDQVTVPEFPTVQ